jgi:hypothetical protein
VILHGELGRRIDGVEGAAWVKLVWLKGIQRGVFLDLSDDDPTSSLIDTARDLVDPNPFS